MAIAVVKNHTVWLMERGGRRRVWQLENVTSVQWGRVRDDISTAVVHVAVTEEASDNNAVLGSLVGATGRYEIAIWRDEECPWQGPITLTQLNGADFEIDARDVNHYLERLAMSKVYDNSTAGTGTDFVVNRIYGIMAFELARKDTAELPFSIPSCNVSPYIVKHVVSTDAKTSKVTPAYFSYVWSHLDDLAGSDGLDYTTIGRAIHLWDTNNPAMGYTPTVTQADFNGKLAFSAYGMELATRSIVTDGQGNWAEADTELHGGVDSYYGLVETLNNPYTTADGTTVPSQADLISQADRNLIARNPTPLQVRVPDGSALNMNGVLELGMLVPGVYMPLVIEQGPFTLSQMQKLAAMTVSETANKGETVTVTMGPASDPDAGVP